MTVPDDPDYLVVVGARIPRMTWALQRVGGKRKRSRRVLDDWLDDLLAGHPELVPVGPRLHSTRPRDWFWAEMTLEQPVSGPYVHELAEGYPGGSR